jgi:hypothetical protein
MSDNAQPTPVVAPEEKAATEAAIRAETQAIATRESQSILSGDPSVASDPVDEKPAAQPVDDWAARRERIARKWAGNDGEKFKQAKRQIDRFASEDNLLGSYLDLRTKLSRGELLPALPEDADEAEIADYRKKAGIPETPDGYELQFPEGMEAPESAKEQLAILAKAAHDLNGDPRVVKGLWNTYLQIQEADAQRRYEAAQEKYIETKALFRSEWGRDYPRNEKATNSFI